MKHRITLIPGDGIGPEVTLPTLAIIKAAGVDIIWEKHLAGAEALKKHGTTIPKALMDSFEKNRVARMADMAAYRDFAGTVLWQLPGVRETRTYAVMEEVKNTTHLKLL